MASAPETGGKQAQKIFGQFMKTRANSRTALMQLKKTKFIDPADPIGSCAKLEVYLKRRRALGQPQPLNQFAKAIKSRGPSGQVLTA